MLTKTYRVWSYDVWGNDEDGYSVNDRSEISYGEFSPDKSDDENIEIVLKDDEGYPVGQIEIEDNKEVI